MKSDFFFKLKLNYNSCFIVYDDRLFVIIKIIVSDYQNKMQQRDTFNGGLCICIAIVYQIKIIQLE